MQVLMQARQEDVMAFLDDLNISVLDVFSQRWCPFDCARRRD